MRILSVSNVPIETHLGSGYVIAGYVERLRASGHEVVTLDPREYEWIPRLRAAKRLRVLCGYSAATLRALRRGTFDLVELWGAEAWWVASRLARRVRRPRLVARSNGLEPHFAAALRKAGVVTRNGPLTGWFDRVQDFERAFRRVDALTTVSTFDRRFALAQHYQPPERILTLENPLPDDLLGRRIAEERARIIGFFGSWLENKGGEILAAALPAVLAAHPGWRARFVGPAEADVQRVLPAEIRARVETIPFVSDRPRLQALYRETAVVAMPSAFESFGLVAAEAMACGAALVASPVGFAADLRPEAEAVLVAQRTPAAWAAALSALLADDMRRDAIARAGYERAQTLRWDVAAARLQEFYAQLLAARPRDHRGKFSP